MDYLTHAPRDGERIDALAFHYYGDPAMMAPILAANPHLFGRYVTSAGPPLVIPLVEVPDAPPAPGLPPWRQ
jgi:phage tail protein X